MKKVVLIILTFALTVQQPAYALRPMAHLLKDRSRLHVPKKPFSSLTDAEILDSLRSETDITVWTTGFSELQKRAEGNSLGYEEVELFFETREGVTLNFAVMVPAALQDELLEVVAKYLSARINNSIVTYGAVQCMVKTINIKIFDRLCIYFEKYYNVPGVNLKLVDIPAIYFDTQQFKIVLYGENTSYNKNKFTKITPAVQTKNTAPVKLLAINIGKTMLKIGIIDMRSNGNFYFVGEPKSISMAELIGEKPDADTFFSNIADTIHDYLAKVQLKIADIGGVGLSVSAVVKDNEILGIRTGILCKFERRDTAKLMKIKDAVSELFPNVPVLVENDGNAEALGLARREGYRNALILKLGTTLASSIIDSDGNVVCGINQFTKTVINMDETAPLHPDTHIKGVAGLFISWTGIENVAKEIGLYEKYGFDDSTQVPSLLADWLDSNDVNKRTDAKAVFHRVGKYIAVLTKELSSYYHIEKVIISGGITARKPGHEITQSAARLSGIVTLQTRPTKIEVKHGVLIGMGYLVSNFLASRGDIIEEHCKAEPASIPETISALPHEKLLAILSAA